MFLSALILMPHSQNCKMKALVSIIIPAYNAEAYLGQALASVLIQSESCFEVLVVNDGSTDGTDALATAFSERDSRIRLLTKTNGGVSSARNLGLSESTGTYIAFLDADDVWLENHLESSLEAINSSDVVVSYPQWVDDKGELIGPYPYGPNESEVSAFPVSLANHNFINPSWLFMRRTVFEKIGGFDEDPEIQHAEDWDYALRMVKANFQFVFSGAKTVMYRRHENAATTKMEQMARVCLKCIDKHYNSVSSEMKKEFVNARAWQFRKLSRVLRVKGDFKSINYAFKALLENPIKISFWKNLIGSFLITSHRSFFRKNSL